MRCKIILQSVTFPSSVALQPNGSRGFTKLCKAGNFGRRGKEMCEHSCFVCICKGCRGCSHSSVWGFEPPERIGAKPYSPTGTGVVG
jgi:hypothetical protein